MRHFSVERGEFLRLQVRGHVLVQFFDRVAVMRQRQWHLLCLYQLVADHQMAFHQAKAEQKIGIGGIFVDRRLGGGDAEPGGKDKNSKG
jgi:hypothetical protein